MKHIKVILVAALLFGTQVLRASDRDPHLIPYVLSSAFIPGGFDSNDKVQIVITGMLANTCYRTGPVKVIVDKPNKTIEVRHRVYRYNAACLLMIVPFHKVVDIGVLPEANYNVINERKETIGVLSVKKASTADADDYLYAPVSDARLKVNSNNERVVTVEGSFSNSCMKLKELRAFLDGKQVVTVLPISEKLDLDRCMPGVFPFVASTTLPGLVDGEYMLNVRSLNGDAVFRFFEVPAR